MNSPSFLRVDPIGPDEPVDLHLHTVASDGSWTPAALIDELAGRSFRVVAVCDHDTQRSVLEVTRLGRERGMIVIPGVEMTCGWLDRQWHLLVYGIAPDRTDSDSAAFRGCLGQIDELLQSRAADAHDRIVGSGRALPSLPDVQGERPLWPFHVLTAAIKDGHAKGLKEAAELVVELGGSFSADLPLDHVVEAAHQARGLVVIAHPGRADAVGIVTEEHLDRMAAEGIRIDGLEAHYRSYTDSQTALYRRIAEERGLLTSCGSDSHGPGQPVNPRAWRAAWCAGLLARLEIEVGMAAPVSPIWTEGMDPEAAVPEPASEPELAAVGVAGDES